MLGLFSAGQRALVLKSATLSRFKLLALMMLAGVFQSCSGDASLNGDNAIGNQGVAKGGRVSIKEYPPGAAAALSLVGSPTSLEGGPFERAVACAAALNITSETVTRIGLASGEKEMNALREAENLFRRQALAQSAGSEEGGRDPSAAVDALVLQERDNPAAQLKLAMTCVQSLEAPN